MTLPMEPLLPLAVDPCELRQADAIMSAPPTEEDEPTPPPATSASPEPEPQPYHTITPGGTEQPSATTRATGDDAGLATAGSSSRRPWLGSMEKQTADGAEMAAAGSSGRRARLGSMERETSVWHQEQPSGAELSGYVDEKLPSWMSPTLGSAPQATVLDISLEKQELAEPTTLDQHDMPEIDDIANDEERDLIELDLVGQIAALQRKLEAVQDSEGEDDLDEESMLQEALLEDTPLPNQDQPSRVLLLTYQLPIRCWRDVKGVIQWEPTNGEANLANAVKGVPQATQVVWFGQIHEAATGDIREDEREGLIKRLATEDARFSMVPIFLPKPLVEKW